MAAKLLQRFKIKSPTELVQKTHQAFVRLPYESSQDRIVEELGRLLSAMKVTCISVPCEVNARMSVHLRKNVMP